MQAQQQKALKAVAIAVATITLSAYNNDNQRINTVNQTDLTTRFSTGGFAHTLLTGIELGHQDSDNKRNTGFFRAPTSATVSTGNPYAIATRFRQNTTDANNKVSTDIPALYAQYQVTLSNEWKLLAGLRYDYFKANREDRRTLVPAANLARTDIGYSPRADAAVYYRFASGKTRLSLNVENAFNKKYWPTVDGDNNISVGAPVNARLTLTTRF